MIPQLLTANMLDLQGLDDTEADARRTPLCPGVFQFLGGRVGELDAGASGRPGRLARRRAPCVGRAASSLPVCCPGLGQLALPASRAAPPSRASNTSGARSPRPPAGPVPPTHFSSSFRLGRGLGGVEGMSACRPRPYQRGDLRVRRRRGRGCGGLSAGLSAGLWGLVVGSVVAS